MKQYHNLKVLDKKFRQTNQIKELENEKTFKIFQKFPFQTKIWR